MLRRDDSPTHTVGSTALYWLVVSLLVLLAGCGDDVKKSSDTPPPDTADGGTPSDTDGSDSPTDGTPDVLTGLGLCSPCQDDVQCGAGADLCVRLVADGEAACGTDCSADPTRCPAGYACQPLGDAAHQCVPTAGTCVDRCAEVSCDTEMFCDPFTGSCRVPLTLCDTDCLHDSLCGGPDDHCVELLADDEVVCARACTLSPDSCPAGYVCTDVEGDTQCVPSALTCVDRCAQAICPTGQICDPFSGACRLPLGACDEGCVHDSLCGTTEADRCVRLPAADEVVCALDCTQDPTVCGPGFFCGTLEDGRSNCLPITLTCRDDRCDGVSCQGVRRCDPLTGSCTYPLDLCEGPCTNNNACLGEDDLCLAFDAQNSFCSASCEESGRCPLGYGCFLLEIGKHFCVPIEQTCAFAEAPCTYETRYADCPGDDYFCTAVRPGDSGHCAPTCTSGSCPSGLSCQEAHLHPATCFATDFDTPESCGRWSDASNPVGRPCGGELSAYCPQPTTACLAPAQSDVAPFCSMPCAQDADCGSGASCVAVAGETSLMCVPDGCAACVADPVMTGSDLLGDALAQLGTTRCGVHLTDAHLALLPYPRRHGSLPTFSALWRSPLLATARARSWLSGAVGAGSAVTRARDQLLRLGQAAGLAPAASPTTYTVDPQQPLAAAVAVLLTATGAVADQAALEADAADVPLALQTQLAPVVLAIADAHAQREQMLGGLAGTPALDVLFAAGHAPFLRLAPGTTLPDLSSPLVAATYEDIFDVSPLVDASANLLSQIAAANLSADPSWGPFAFEVDTPLGKLLVYGNENSTYAASDSRWNGDVVLLVDAGGDDVYEVPCGANQSLQNSVAVHLDLGGSDQYRYVEDADPADAAFLPSDGGGRYVPAAALNQDDGPVSLSNVARQGAGRFGVGLLVDLGAGNDHYWSLRLSQGFGLFGVGVLVDDGGTDEYRAEAASQGAGLWGIGLLVDGDGDDSYTGWHLVQGAAGTSGIGALVDLEGADQYVARAGESNQTDVLYYTIFDRARSNTSVAQGASVGRGPFLGHELNYADWALGGGLGLLVDGGGNDSYRAGAIAQGAGAMGGAGFLLEAGGDDSYDARRIMQGSATHGGLGVLLDQQGSDGYGTLIDRLGSGHGAGDDVAVGIAIDDQGDDQRNLAASSGGAAVRNGVGFLVDHGGIDTYELLSEQALGFATVGEGIGPGDPRVGVATTGIFVDGDGTDVYGPAATLPSGAGNDAQWLGGSGASEQGVGVDGVGSTGL